MNPRNRYLERPARRLARPGQFGAIGSKVNLRPMALITLNSVSLFGARSPERLRAPATTSRAA